MGLLAAEHRHIEASLHALSVSRPGRRRRRLARELNSILANHLQVEETTLHPLVRDIVGSPQEEESDVEHELIRGGLSQAMQLVDAPGFCSAVDMLSAGVRRHVDDEEQAILPALIGQLTLGEQSALGDAIMDSRQDPDRLLEVAARWSELPAANAFNAGH